MIDGVVSTNVMDALVLDPQNVIAIRLSYKLKTINSSGIVGLANYGILSIDTKMNTNKVKGSNHKIYQDFYVPSIFSTPTYDRNSHMMENIPDFRNQIFWIPFLEVVNEAEFSFYLSDELGEFSVETLGVLNDGTIFRAEETIIVDP